MLGGGIAYFGADEKVKLENPQVIVWDKPKTDEEWAEDVKQESFHIKSTGVLEEMTKTHTDKLNKFLEMDELTICPECIKYRLGKAYPDASESEINKLFANELSSYTWQVEKLKQSVERMDKELELRSKGFVVVEGEEGLFGGFKDEKYVRKIND